MKNKNILFLIRMKKAAQRCPVGTFNDLPATSQLVRAASTRNQN